MSAYSDDLTSIRSDCDQDMIFADRLPQPGRCVSVLATKHHYSRKTNTSQSPTGNLGCQVRRQLTYGEDVRTLFQSMSSLINLLRALGGTTCRWHTPDRCQVYIAVVRSVIEYAIAAWAPWLSATAPISLERLHLEAAVAIISLVRSTPVKAAFAENQLTPISTCFQATTLPIAEEEANFLPLDRQTLFTQYRRRLMRKDWRSTQLLRHIQLDRNSHVLPPIPPSSEKLPIPLWDRPPPSRQSLLQPRHHSHHHSKDTIRFKPLSPSFRRTSISSAMVPFEMESRTVVAV